MLRVDEIALAELLTEEVLLKEVFSGQKDTFWVKMKKRQVIADFRSIFKLYPAIKNMYDKKIVLYSFIRLWHEGKVQRFQFERAWRTNIYIILTKYGEHYDEHIKNKQQSFKKNK